MSASTWWNVQHWAVECTEADFRTVETALYQVLHRTTTNEPLRMVQQLQGQTAFEAWHLIVRRYDQRNTSDRSSAYAARNSNVSKRDRAKDAEQFDDILRNFTNDTKRKDSGSEKVAAREFAELTISAIRRIAHRAGEHHHRQGPRHIRCPR